jgi:hypothetical protein
VESESQSQRTPPGPTDASLQLEPIDEHDLGLIIERLAWTPEQRLDANTAFLQFYLSARPDGPIISGDR